MYVSFNLSETTRRRAVCGKTARTVRREGGRNSMRPPYPYQGWHGLLAIVRAIGFTAPPQKKKDRPGWSLGRVETKGPDRLRTARLVRRLSSLSWAHP